MVASVMVIVAITLVVVAIPVQRYSGPRFTFEPPKAITVVKGEKMVERKVKFPNFLPFQWSVTFSVAPLFKVGDVIEVDLSLLEEGKVNKYSIRVDGKPTDTKGKDVSFSYIFKLKNGSELPENKKVVRLKIDSVSSDGPIAHHQNDHHGGEWFWFREIYIVTLVIGG